MTKRFFIALILSSVSFCCVKAESPKTATDRWHNYKRTSYMSIRFGLNVPTIRYKGTGGTAQTNPLPRFHLSFIYGNKLGKGLPFYLETGVSYTEKGAEIEAADEYEFRKCNLKYLQIPVVLKYRWTTNVDDFTIQPFFGGYIACGVGGKTKLYTSRTKQSSFGDNRYNRFDAGIRAGCGLSYQNLYFETGYEAGLYNIAGDQYTDYHYDDFDGFIRNGNFFMTLGVNF